jgi:NADPH:quinone reductase
MIKSGKVPPVDVLRLSERNIKVMRPALLNYLTTRDEFEAYAKDLFELIMMEKVNVKIHDVYPLRDVGRAHADLEGRATTGKLVLKV